QVGYRLVQGGLGICKPVVETVDRLDLTNMIIDIRVAGAYCKGGIPLNVEGVANVKIASTEPQIGNAIERFLGKPRAEIIRVARETLEGNLRGVLSTLTPEEVNQDRIKFAESLLQEAGQDLTRLGLELDTLKIQNVSDDKGYLDSLGRKQSAALIMRSRIAEAENKALAAQRNAENVETKEIAQIDAQIATARAEAERRIIDAQTRKDAMVAEQQSEVSAAVVKAQAEVEVQKARLEQVRLRLMADRIKPAEAKRQQMVEAARGRSARVVEDGKATAAAIRRIAQTWAEAGDDARQIFVAQKLGTLVGHLMSTVDHMDVDKVTFIDKRLTDSGSNLAVNAAVTSEQLKHTMGIDIPALLGRLGAGLGGAAQPATDSGS
ncbi:MAG: SPFH domain-containing protein, partial [Myxococcota bacterium]